MTSKCAKLCPGRLKCSPVVLFFTELEMYPQCSAILSCRLLWLSPMYCTLHFFSCYAVPNVICLAIYLVCYLCCVSGCRSSDLLSLLNIGTSWAPLALCHSWNLSFWSYRGLRVDSCSNYEFLYIFLSFIGYEAISSRGNLLSLVSGWVGEWVS